MSEIPEGFELYVDEDGDQIWINAEGVRHFFGPEFASEHGPGWRPLYVGPPPPKPKTLEDKVRDLASRFDRMAEEDPVASRSRAWIDAADDLRGLLS